MTLVCCLILLKLDRRYIRRAEEADLFFQVAFNAGGRLPENVGGNKPGFAKALVCRAWQPQGDAAKPAYNIQRQRKGGFRLPFGLLLQERYCAISSQ